MSRTPERELPTSAFDYELPDDRIARYPAAQRDESRLMVLDPPAGNIEHRQFRDIVEYFDRYRRQLESRADIASVSGLSSGDLGRLRSLYGRR